MEVFFYLVTAAFAVYRISYAFSLEDGLFDILAQIRDALGVRYDEQSRAYSENAWGKLIMCPYCLSFWLSIPVGVAFVFWGDAVIYALIPFALGGLVHVILRLSEA